MKKIIRKNLGIKLLGAVNCLALCLTAYTANRLPTPCLGWEKTERLIYDMAELL